MPGSPVTSTSCACPRAAGAPELGEPARARPRAPRARATPRGVRAPRRVVEQQRLVRARASPVDGTTPSSRCSRGGVGVVGAHRPHAVAARVVQAHQRAVPGLAQRVAADQPLRRSRARRPSALAPRRAARARRRSGRAAARAPRGPTRRSCRPAGRRRRRRRAARGSRRSSARSNASTSSVYGASGAPAAASACRRRGSRRRPERAAQRVQHVAQVRARLRLGRVRPQQEGDAPARLHRRGAGAGTRAARWRARTPAAAAASRRGGARHSRGAGCRGVAAGAHPIDVAPPRVLPVRAGCRRARSPSRPRWWP